MAYDRAAMMPIILERIAEGESLRAICRSEGMPNRKTVREWLDADDEEGSQYAREYAQAHEDQGDYYADLIKEVVAERPPMVGDTNHQAGDARSEDGNTRMDSAFVAWKRLQADSYKWIASQLHPKKYGKAQVDLTHSGPGGGPIETISRIERVIVHPQN